MQRFIVSLFLILCSAATAASGTNEAYRFTCNYFKCIEILKGIEARSDHLDAIIDDVSDEEFNRRFEAHLRSGMEASKAAQQVIGQHQDAGIKVVGEAAHYLFIAFQIREHYFQEMLNILEKGETDTTDAELASANESLQAFWDIFKDASSLARMALKDPSRQDDEAYMTHLTVTRDQRKDLLGRVCRLFGEDPAQTYQEHKGIIELQGASYASILNSALKSSDED